MRKEGLAGAHQADAAFADQQELARFPGEQKAVEGLKLFLDDGGGKARRAPQENFLTRRRAGQQTVGRGVQDFLVGAQGRVQRAEHALIILNGKAHGTIAVARLRQYVNGAAGGGALEHARWKALCLACVAEGLDGFGIQFQETRDQALLLRR